MEGMEAVIDAPEIDSESSSVETVVSSPETQPQQTEADDPYSSKFSKEMSARLKELRDAHPDAAKYLRQAKDDHARLFQLQQIEKRGIDGIRETYALLDSVMHGELKGTEAIAALQDEIRNVAETDALLAAGDPRALEALGEDFNEGLAKLTPTILDRVRDSDPEAYAEAVLPHFVEALKSSDLVRDFNAMVDVLNEQPPKWLTDGQKAQWAQDRMERVIALAANQGKWLNAQAEKVKGIKPGESQPGAKRANGAGTVSDERKAFETEQQNHHWKTNISPQLDNHAKQKFDEQFRPYAKRLRLDGTATNALRQAFIDGVVGKAKGNKAYMDQIGRYRAQKNPDPKLVVNFAKVEFDKHAKSVMEGLVNERYKPFLNGKPNTNQNGNGAPKKSTGPVSPNVQIVSVRPAEGTYDPKRRTLEQIHNKIFPLKNGKIVQVRT